MQSYRSWDGVGSLEPLPQSVMSPPAGSAGPLGSVRDFISDSSTECPSFIRPRSYFPSLLCGTSALLPCSHLWEQASRASFEISACALTIEYFDVGPHYCVNSVCIFLFPLPSLLFKSVRNWRETAWSPRPWSVLAPVRFKKLTFLRYFRVFQKVLFILCQKFYSRHYGRYKTIWDLVGTMNWPF